MTVTAPDRLFYEYVADGLATERNIGFPLRRPSDLVVAANGVPQVLGQHYSVVGTGPDQRIKPLAPFWPSGAVIGYWRQTARAQEYDVPAGVDIRNESLEDELDRNQLQQQEQDADIGRAIKVPMGEPGASLPSAANRAGRIFAFGADGGGIFDIDADRVRDLLAAVFAPVFTQLASLVMFLASGVGAIARSVQDKLRDAPVSVKDFGAVGNDSANDTAAFTAAAATGRPVILPDGTYRVNGCLFNARVIFMPGAKIRRTGGLLAFAGGIEAPVQQIFLDAVGIAQVDVNNDLTPVGWADWFGTDANALETCHTVFKVMMLAGRDYVTTRTTIFDKSNRLIIGQRGSAQGAGGTRIVLTGAAAATEPVVRVGTLNTTTASGTARRLNISGINTIRDGVAIPAASGRREDAVRGWLIAGWYESEMKHCFDYGSPIHYRVYGTITCTMRDCYGVRPDAGASNGHPDYYTGMVVGGYSPSFGFIGANASLTIDNCGTAGGVGTDRTGLFLFGAIGDTWVRLFECSQIEYGITVDGRDASGAILSSLQSHQDVRIRECVLDAITFRGIWVRGINAGGHVTLSGNYVALNAAGDGTLVQDCTGAVSFTDEDMIGNSTLANFGFRIVTSKRVSVDPSCKVKDFRVGLKAESSSDCDLSPTIHRNTSGGTNAVELLGAVGVFSRPTVSANSAVYDYGVSSDSATANCEVNLTKVNKSALTTGSATRKLWHNGSTWGGGGTFGTGNIATGVLT